MSDTEMGIQQAREKFADLIDAARFGHTTYITRYGRRVAAVMPLEDTMTTITVPAVVNSLDLLTLVIDGYGEDGVILDHNGDELAAVTVPASEDGDEWAAGADAALAEAGFRRVGAFVHQYGPERVEAHVVRA